MSKQDTSLKIKELQEKHGIAGRVSFERREGDFVNIQLNQGKDLCVVSLYGGHLRSCTLSGRSCFWESSKALFQNGKAIRGGVPIVFPWFGSHPDQSSFPSHGFARISPWEVVSTRGDGDTTTLVMELKDSPESLKLWPQSFQLRQEVTLSATSLVQTLSVTNTGSEPWTWAGGFHPYFQIEDIDSTHVLGLENESYVNLINREHFLQKGGVRFKGEVDRAYISDGKNLRIEDDKLEQQFSLKCDGANSVVVWNPSVEKAKSDMPADGPQHFVCVEPAKDAHVGVWSQRSTLEPGKTATLGYEVS